jgi:hypothetical protein
MEDDEVKYTKISTYPRYFYKRIRRTGRCSTLTDPHFSFLCRRDSVTAVAVLLVFERKRCHCAVVNGRTTRSGVTKEADIVYKAKWKIEGEYLSLMGQYRDLSWRYPRTKSKEGCLDWRKRATEKHRGRK